MTGRYWLTAIGARELESDCRSIGAPRGPLDPTTTSEPQQAHQHPGRPSRPEACRERRRLVGPDVEDGPTVLVFAEIVARDHWATSHRIEMQSSSRVWRVLGAALGGVRYGLKRMVASREPTLAP
jgi:hypothetical protein